MRLALLFLLLVIIITGFLIVPFRTGFAIRNPSVYNPLSDNLGRDAVSPSNWIDENQIEIDADRIIIHINNSQLSRFGNTGSMLPSFDATANGIIIRPSGTADIHFGDIIAFEQDDVIVVHRVIETGYDGEGWYAITKGDNNTGADDKIRFQQIKYVVIALIY